MPRFFGLEKCRVGAGKGIISTPSRLVCALTSSSKCDKNCFPQNVTPELGVMEQNESQEVYYSQEKKLSSSKTSVAKNAFANSKDSGLTNNVARNDHSNTNTGTDSATKKLIHRSRRRKKGSKNITLNKDVFSFPDDSKTKEVESYDLTKDQARPLRSVKSKNGIILTDNKSIEMIRSKRKDNCTKSAEDNPEKNDEDDSLIDEDEIISCDENDATPYLNNVAKEKSPDTVIHDKVGVTKCVSCQQSKGPTKKDVLQRHLVSSSIVDCSLVKEIWFPHDSAQTSNNPKLGLKIPLIPSQGATNAESGQQVRFPFVIPDSKSTDLSNLFLVRTYSNDGTSFGETLENISYIEDEEGNSFGKMSDNDITELIRRHQSFATLQWETQILYILFACSLKNKLSSENYFLVPNFITYEKRTESIKLTLHMQNVTKDLPRFALASKSASLILGTIQDVLNLHIQLKSGPFPEEIIAYFAIQMLSIIKFVHSSGVTHNNISLNSFIFVRERTNEEGSSYSNTGRESYKWTLKMIGFGANSSLIRCNNMHFKHSPGFSGNILSQCEKLHFEQDFYGFANIVHMLLTGGVRMMWRRVYNEHKESRNEINLRSLIIGNKYLHGSLAWESLFDELLNSRDKNSCTHDLHGVCKDTILDRKDKSSFSETSIGQQTKPAKAGKSSLLTKSIQLLQSISADDMSVTKYMDELYGHIEKERKSPKGYKKIGNSSFEHSNIYTHIPCSERGKINTPHSNVQYQIYDLSEKPLLLTSKGLTLDNNNALDTRDTILIANKNKVAQLERELNRVMSTGEKELSASKQQFYSKVQELKQKDILIEELKCLQRTIERNHEKHLRELRKLGEKNILEKQQNNNALEMENNYLKDKVKKLYVELEKMEKMKDIMKKQEEQLYLVSQDSKVKEETIKEHMFLLSKKQHTIANLESRIKHYSKKMKELEVKYDDRRSETMDSCNQKSFLDREKLLHHKEHVFKEKVKKFEILMQRKSNIIQSKEEALEQIFWKGMKQFDQQGRLMDPKFNQTHFDFTNRMKSLYDKESTLRYRIRCFEFLRNNYEQSRIESCQNSMVTQLSNFHAINQKRVNPTDLSNCSQLLNENSRLNLNKRAKTAYSSGENTILQSVRMDQVQVPNIPEYSNDDLISTCSLQINRNSM